MFLFISIGTNLNVYRQLARPFMMCVTSSGEFALQLFDHRLPSHHRCHWKATECFFPQRITFPRQPLLWACWFSWEVRLLWPFSRFAGRRTSCPSNKVTPWLHDTNAPLLGKLITEQMRKDWVILFGRHYYSLSATLTHFIWGYVLTRASCVFPAIALLLCTKVRCFIWLRQMWVTLPLSAPPLTDMFFFREAETLLSSQRSRLTKRPETHLVQSSRRRRHFQLPIWVLMIEIKTFTRAFDSLRVPRKTKHVKDVVASLWPVDLSHPGLC